MIHVMRFALVVFLMQAGLVYGETYKCRHASGRVEFTDKPCPEKSTTENVSATAFPADQPSVAGPANSRNVHLKTLDSLVSEAIGRGDLRSARELATTPEHWSKIHEAEAPRQKTSAEIQAEIANSEECKRAKRNYELEAGLVKQEKESIDAKKRFMYSACGMQEPNSVNVNNTVNVVK